MDGTASGKERHGVNAASAALLAVLLLAGNAANAQTTGRPSFRVLQGGATIGTMDVTVAREEDGWHITSTGQARGTIDVTVKRFEAHYDREWHARFLTVERAGPRSSTLVHAVAGRNTAHVDIVTEKEARWHSHSISPDTIFLPDAAYAAFVAIAARLNGGGARAEIPLLLVPDSERRAVVDAWESVMVETRAGPLRASRHTLSIVGAAPRLLHVWEARGDLLRVEIPQDGVSVVRDDVL